MYVAVHHGGMRLAEVVRQLGMKYQTGAQAVKRFGQMLADEPERKRFLSKLRNGLSTFQTLLPSIVVISTATISSSVT